MTAGLEDRLTELEVRLSFLDDTVQSLSDSLARHDRLLDELRTELERVRADLSANRLAAPGHDVHDEPPPPHY